MTSKSGFHTVDLSNSHPKESDLNQKIERPFGSRQTERIFPAQNVKQEEGDMPGAQPGSTGKLLLCFCGVFVCYFYFGILQEKITKGSYGENEKFNYFLCLLFLPCVFNALYAKAVLYFTSEGSDPTSHKLYAACSVTYLGAMVASNMALRYVSYPFQVLGKSCKPIPVMILGVLLARKSYPLMKYFCVLLIVFGVATFVYKDKGASKNSDHFVGIGEVLVMVSLTFDGLTGAIQENMRGRFQTRPHHMMFSMNAWSILYLGIAIFVTGEVFEFIPFVLRHPSVLPNIVLFGLASAFGQHFIFMTVATYGPLTCSIITTTRKFFTILGSVIFFSNPISSRQWIGVALVFAGLGLDSIFGKSKAKPKN
ncbi:solute carrier family 35 member B1 [Strongylocentrotus purpuratus]|uniref:Solute carrier family 35 member B1 n=1 Tax=Strongylocentrotus purpuratus TaxID=7668 RepID=A0A7M7SSX6_STRPU|nr:solute carrier family 35 member B1 [Strongylocentrotus purpuratus]